MDFVVSLGTIDGKPALVSNHGWSVTDIEAGDGTEAQPALLMLSGNMDLKSGVLPALWIRGAVHNTDANGNKVVTPFNFSLQRNFIHTPLMKANNFFEQVGGLFKAGITLFTHVFDAISSFGFELEVKIGAFNGGTVKFIATNTGNGKMYEFPIQWIGDIAGFIESLCVELQYLPMRIG